MKCPECKSANMAKAGKTWRGRKLIQRWRCKNCGRIWTEVSPTIKEAAK